LELNNYFTKAYFYITDVSKSVLNSLEINKIFSTKFRTYVLNAFDGSSLLNFLLTHHKFDLIIASHLNLYSPNKKQLLYFFQFMYKHFLKKKGDFFLIFNKEIYKLAKDLILNEKKSFLDKIIKIQTAKNSLYISYFTKNENLSILEV